MNIKPPNEVLRKPITTWLSSADHERFLRAAAEQHVTAAAYLRSIVVDAVAEDETCHASPTARTA
jgi:hypothetical protein